MRTDEDPQKAKGCNPSADGIMIAFFRFMTALNTICAKRDQIYALARKHKAEKLWVFGSCARQEETADSDVDLLVKFSPSASWRDDLALATACGEVIGRRVDVVRNTAVMTDPYFAAQVCPEAVRL